MSDFIMTPSFELTGTYPRTAEQQAIGNDLADRMLRRHVDGMNREMARLIESLRVERTYERVDQFDLFSKETIPTYRRTDPL